MKRKRSSRTVFSSDGALEITPQSKAGTSQLSFCPTSPGERSLDGHSAWIPVLRTQSLNDDAAENSEHTMSSFTFDGFGPDGASNCNTAAGLSEAEQRQVRQKLDFTDQDEKPQASPGALRASAQRFSKQTWEISGLLRTKLCTEADFLQLREQISSHINFLVHDLPHACNMLSVQPQGLVFQGLLARVGCGRGAASLAAQARMDAILGEEHVNTLAESAQTLCSLLRVKIEDDGDLLLARRVLEDCQRCFHKISAAAEKSGVHAWQILHAALNF